jgi:hypothetical protein
MLSEGQLAPLEPLIEACWPKGETPPQDLWRTVSAILWRHENRAKWRAVPEELGSWWRQSDLHPLGTSWRLGRLLNLEPGRAALGQTQGVEGRRSPHAMRKLPYPSPSFSASMLHSTG